MNDGLIIQHVSGDWDGANMLKVSFSRTLEYCMIHKCDLQVVMSGDSPTAGDWTKVQMLRAAMDAVKPDGGRQYKYLAYLDADTLIVDLTADMREACPADKIGCCRHVLTSPPYSIELDHLNVGAVYLQNTEANRANVDKWLAGAPGTTTPPWWQQGVLNETGIGVEIDAKWNATGKVNPSPNPVVLGFHGQGNTLGRFNQMVTALKENR